MSQLLQNSSSFTSKLCLGSSYTLIYLPFSAVSTIILQCIYNNTCRFVAKWLLISQQWCPTLFQAHCVIQLLLEMGIEPINSSSVQLLLKFGSGSLCVTVRVRFGKC